MGLSAVALSKLDTHCMQTPALTPFPDLTAPELAYPLFAQSGIDPRFVTRISGVYLKNLDMPELIEKVSISSRRYSGR